MWEQGVQGSAAHNNLCKPALCKPSKSSSAQQPMKARLRTLLLKSTRVMVHSTAPASKASSSCSLAATYSTTPRHLPQGSNPVATQHSGTGRRRQCLSPAPAMAVSTQTAALRTCHHTSCTRANAAVAVHDGHSYHSACSSPSRPPPSNPRQSASAPSVFSFLWARRKPRQCAPSTVVSLQSQSHFETASGSKQHLRLERRRVVFASNKRRHCIARAVSSVSLASLGSLLKGNSTPKAEQSSSSMDEAIPHHWREQMRKASFGRRRVLQRYFEEVGKVNALEPAIKQLSDLELQGKTAEFKQRLAQGESLRSLRPEAFAVVREAALRVLGKRHYDSQLVGGMVLDEGQVAEMYTGEGKTLVATLPAYLNALTGRGVHVITVNDYLAARDAEWMGKVFRFLGLTCSAVQGGMKLNEAKAAFASDITYVTGQELCFTYLRDNSAMLPSEVVLSSEPHFALIDEVDSILIDESRNPMIISQPINLDTKLIKLAHEAVKMLYDELEAWVDAKAPRQPTTQSISHFMEKDLQRDFIGEIYGKLLDKKIDVYIRSIVMQADSTALATAVNIVLDPSCTQSLSSLTEDELSLYEALRACGVDKVIMDAKAEYMAHRQSLLGSVKANLMNVDERQRSMSLTDLGAKRLAHNLNVHQRQIARQAWEKGDKKAPFHPPQPISNLWESGQPWGTLVFNSLRAHEFYIRDKQYIVRDGKVVIIDESTGRPRMDSRWQNGLHQAIEAKEGLEILADTRSSASVTFQLFFRRYEKLAGMTGTAQAAAGELFELYGLKVVPVPTNKPSRRLDHPHRLYLSQPAKMFELAETVKEALANGRPVLIGTSSVGESELVLAWLQSTSPRLNVQLLNAKPSLIRTEAQIVAQAGLPGAVTIATNMAGRGTDIILGGNPEGLAKLCVMRLIYRHRLKDEDDQETNIPHVPIPIFDSYDNGTMYQGAANKWASLPPYRRLPRSIHTALQAAYLLTQVDQHDPNRNAYKLTFDEVAQMASWVMDQAERLRKNVYAELRLKYGPSSEITDLNYEVLVAPVAEEMLRREEALRRSASQGQWLSLSCCLQLWLWFDQQCSAWAELIRKAGGLLVIGTSINDSRRIEQQLRGRAGRQGDPGETMMMIDLLDPYVQLYGLGPLARGGNHLFELSQNSLQYLEGAPVIVFIDSIFNLLESGVKTMRLETKRYDEVMETYRRHLYSLRRLVLNGDRRQRSQVLYMMIQRRVDAIVSELLDAEAGPSAWTQPSLSRQQLQLTRGRGRGQTDELISPLQALFEKLDVLVNAAADVSPGDDKLQVEFQKVVDNGVQDAETLKTLRFLGVLGSQRDIRMPIERIPLLSEEQTQSVVAFLATGSPLKWPSPESLELRNDIHLRLLRLRHRQLFNFSTAGRPGAASEVPPAADAALKAQAMNRPQLTGRHARKVAVLRDFLGEAMLNAYEMRRLAYLKSWVMVFKRSQVEAENETTALEQQVMLTWMDGLWSCFLEDSEALKKAVMLRGLASSNPLQEFQIEANRAFLALMDNFRDAVVEKIFMLEASCTVDIPEASSDTATAPALPANGAIAAALNSKSKQPQPQPAAAANGNGATSNGSGSVDVVAAVAQTAAP